MLSEFLQMVLEAHEPFILHRQPNQIVNVELP